MLQIINKGKYWLTFSGTLMLISLIVLLVWNLKYGIDFTGGSLMELEFSGPRPTQEQILEKLSSLELGNINIQPLEENGFVLKFKSVDENTHQNIISTLKENFEKLEEKRFESVGAVIGKDLRIKSIYSLLVVLVGIIVYIAWAFRRVSWPVSSWKYGVAATIALFHDILITVGFFVILGKFWGVEVNTTFVAALLTILGYSVNDTIVVFDRIRENLTRRREEFETIVNISINETIARSINTSLTVVLVLAAILIFGGATINDFVIALIFGIIIGTYSSIFVASPLLVFWLRRAKIS